ncbi:cytochrome P450 [Thalassococcus sp. BH17M4-6]|uniref:cytochrome P450 n=1 Tax=Thalassococcus sp. BH17M4-6 TaxID=3413148 RepID=UPI003BD5C4BC
MPQPQPENDPGPRLPVRVPLGHEPLGLLASLRAARSNIVSIIPDAATHLPIVSGRTGKRWHMVMEPDALKHILLDRLEDYPKSVVTKNLLRPAVGDSLFIAEGAHWRWQRRTAAPVFSHRNVRNLAPVMTDAALRCCDRIAAAGPRAVNLFDEMVTTTFDVIADVTLSGGGGFDRASVHRAIDVYISEAGKISLFDVLGLPDWVPRPGRMVAADEMRAMKANADRAIEARKAQGGSGVPDLLDLLLGGSDPDSGRAMTTEELRDNLLTFIVAGHETTALTLSWALYLCAFDPAVQDRARAEVQSVLQGRAATGADVDQLPVIRSIIDEALRLYPPAAMVSRTAQTRDTVCGVDIRPGDTVMIPIYALHRHRALWSDPDGFDPDRWQARKSAPRYAYLPFGDGPRICIGASFALQEAVIILATLLARFRFTAVPGRDPDPVMILTLRPEGGVWLEAEPV